MVTSAANAFAGPAYACIGLGTALTDLGLVVNASVKILLNRQSALNEAGQALSDGQWGAVVGAQVSLTLHAKTAAILAALLPEAGAGSASTYFTGQWAKNTPDTLVIVPIGNKGSGVTAATNIWLPAVVPDDISEFVHGLKGGAGAQDDANPYTVTFRATLDATCRSKYQIAWIGDPSYAGKGTWALPAGY